jgi:hypothetical protein
LVFDDDEYKDIYVVRVLYHYAGIQTVSELQDSPSHLDLLDAIGSRLKNLSFINAPSIFLEILDFDEYDDLRS